MARQTWLDLRARALLLMRNRNDTDILTSIEAWLTQSQAEIAASYRFFQLEATAARTLSATFSEITISDISDLNYIISVRSNFLNRRLVRTNTRKLDQQQRATGTPTRYVHFGNKIEFDRTANIDYSFAIRYKQTPAFPIFSGSNAPVLPYSWDDIILYRAAKKGFKELLEHEMAEFYRNEEAKLIAEIPTAELVEEEDMYHSMTPAGGYR